MTEGEAVSKALRFAKQLLSQASTLQELLDAVAARRGRPIVVHDAPLPPGGATGLYLPQLDRDCFFVREGVTPPHREAILAHELGHLLMGHEARPTGAPNTHLVSEHLRERMLSRNHGYADAQEREAETFATLLMLEMKRRGNDPLNDRLL